MSENKFPWSFLASFLGSLALLIFVSIVAVINKHNFRFFISVFSKEEVVNIHTPDMDIETDKITRGIVGLDEAKHLTRETIQEKFTFRKKTYVILTAKASGSLNMESKQEKVAYVLLRIFIDGVVRAEDCMELNRGVLTRLAASTTEADEFEPGVYVIKVESIFYGPVQDTRTSLNYMLLTKGLKKLKEFMD